MKLPHLVLAANQDHAQIYQKGFDPAAFMRVTLQYKELDAQGYVKITLD